MLLRGDAIRPEQGELAEASSGPAAFARFTSCDPRLRIRAVCLGPQPGVIAERPDIPAKCLAGLSGMSGFGGGPGRRAENKRPSSRSAETRAWITSFPGDSRRGSWLDSQGAVTVSANYAPQSEACDQRQAGPGTGRQRDAGRVGLTDSSPVMNSVFLRLRCQRQACRGTNQVECSHWRPRAAIRRANWPGRRRSPIFHRRGFGLAEIWEVKHVGQV